MIADENMEVHRMCRTDDLSIAPVGSWNESDLLDALLWEVLWQPLGLPRDIRRSFGLKGDCIELAASARGSILGGLVARWTSAHEVEICHIAVRTGSQNMGIGSMLIEHLVGILGGGRCSRIHVIARSTSQSFFRGLGFSAVEVSPPQHPDFLRLGISFVVMMREYSESFRLRRFRMSDLEQLRQLICSTIDVCYTGVYPLRAVDFFKEYHSEKEIAKREKAGTILVAELNGALVATGSLIGNEIAGVFVHPQMQHHGYGRKIMRELEELARARGLRNVDLSVSLPSRRFYESLGYEIVCSSTIDVGAGERLDFWMAKKALQNSTSGFSAPDVDPVPQQVYAWKFLCNRRLNKP